MSKQFTTTGSGQRGLKNERPGGETVPKDDVERAGPYCVYFVYRSFQRPSYKESLLA